MRVGALVLLMVLWTPQGANQANLADFGTITWSDTRPNVERIETTIRFVFDLFPDVDIPPTTIRIMRLEEYEESVAQLEAGPAWRQWLQQFRSQVNWMVAATTDKRQASQGKLYIMAYGEMPDMILIHECLHYIFYKVEPGSYQNRDRPVLNNEQTVQLATGAILVSLRYREYLRKRPWVQ